MIVAAAKTGEEADMATQSETTQPAENNVGKAERAVDRAFSTGKVDRAYITRQAQLDAAEAVAMAGIAMESDEAADEAARLSVIASNMGNRERAKTARERERQARDQAKTDHRAATRSARKAYEAIKFSDPTKLGFLRVVQLTFLLHIVITILVLLFTSRDTVSYDPATLIGWLMTVLESVAFYFFVNRFKIGRKFVMVMAAFGIVTSAVMTFASGNFTVVNLILGSSYYLFLLLYFTFSKRVKATLVNDLAHDKGKLDDEEFVIDRKGWPFWRNLIIYFVVFSVLGHWLEAGFCQLIRLGIVQGEFHEDNTMLWRDWFYPYPMHGTAVVLMALVLYPIFIKMKKTFKNKFTPYVISFLINMLTCTLIEFCGGLMFNANLQNWDYSNMPFNFMGQICLQNAIGFGIASSVISWWVYPMMERAIARVRPAIMNIVCVVVAIAGGILFSLYAISPPEGVDLGGKQPEVTVEIDDAERTKVKDGANSINELAGAGIERIKEYRTLSDDEKRQIEEHYRNAQREFSAVSDLMDKEPSNKQDGSAAGS